MKKLLALTTFISLISGCMSYGRSDFSCKNVPAGAGCTSSRDVYEMTNGGAVPGKQSINKVSATRKVKSDPIIDKFVTPNLPDRPIPVRTPATDLRIWVAPWVDEDQSYIAPGYIYTEVERRKWVLGKPDQSIPTGKVLKPLNAQGSEPESFDNQSDK